jgi:hypothetical protein
VLKIPVIKENDIHDMMPETSVKREVNWWNLERGNIANYP